MENFLADLKIFRIHVGPDPLNGMSYKIGQSVSTGDERIKCEIIAITRNETNYHFFGSLAYIIWAKRLDNNEKFVYRYIEGMPVYITPAAPDSEQEKKIIQYYENT